jgi:hypothetical protein
MPRNTVTPPDRFACLLGAGVRRQRCCSGIGFSGPALRWRRNLRDPVSTVMSIHDSIHD